MTTATFSEKIVVQMEIFIQSFLFSQCLAHAGILCWEDMNATLVAKFQVHCL